MSCDRACMRDNLCPKPKAKDKPSTELMAGEGELSATRRSAASIPSNFSRGDTPGDSDSRGYNMP
jgi:hypothetical protein